MWWLLSRDQSHLPGPDAPECIIVMVSVLQESKSRPGLTTRGSDHGVGGKLRHGPE